MDLRQMRHVTVLGRHLSFTKAADELGISQSALTRSIQTIEAGAGIALFDRDRSHVRLTRIGETYAQRAAQLLDEADELENLLQRSAKARIGEVALGIAPLPARALLPAILPREVSADTRLRIQITIGEAEVLADAVVAGRIDACICAELPLAPPMLRTATLGRFPITALVRVGHPLLGGTSGERRFPLVASASVGGAYAEALAGMVDLPPRLVVNDFALLARITCETDAVWLASRLAASEEIAAGKLVELALPDSRDFGAFRLVMYSPSRRSLSPGLIHLHDLLRAQAALLAA